MDNNFENFAIESRNFILKCTDNYIDNLKILKEHIINKIPKRDLYSDCIEIELIKLVKFIDIIEEYSLKAITEGMIRINLRQKIIQLLCSDIKYGQKYKKIIDLISKGYTKKEISKSLFCSEATLRKDLKRLGDKLLTNDFIKLYINESNCTDILNEDGGFKDIFKFISDLF